MSWTQIEKLALAYRRNPSTTTALPLDRCLRKAQSFIDKITKFYVKTHTLLEEASAAFAMSAEGVYPEAACEYNPETKIFTINPVGILTFQEACKNAKEILGTSAGRENFSVYRLNAYMSELQKLPSQLLLFLLLFQEKARVLEVTQVEHRRNSVKREIDQSDLEYLNFLWGFRELEHMYKSLNGSNLRSDLHFTWFESEWISGNR